MADPRQNYAEQRRREALMRESQLSQQVGTPSNVKPGGLETAKAFFINQSLVGSSLVYGSDRVTENAFAGEAEEGFNPYTYWYENRDRFEDIGQFIQQGKFDDVRNPLAFGLRAERYRKELENRKTEQGGPLWGQLLGMGLSMIDITSLIPGLGQMRKAKTLVDLMKNTGKVAGYGAGLTAAQEVALHQMQDQRTVEESLYGIGAGAAFGAGLGALVSGNPKSIFHATNPDHPLTTKKPIEIGEWRPGKDMQDAKREAVPEPASVGAKSAEDYTYKIRGQDKHGRVRTYGSKFFNLFTPGGRMVRSLSQTARKVYYEMADSPQTFTEENLQGVAHHPAEITASRYYQDFMDLREEAEMALVQVNQRLGEKDSAAKQEAKSLGARAVNYGRSLAGKEENVHFNPVERWEYNELVNSALHGGLNKQLRDQWLERLGSEDMVDDLFQTAKKSAKAVQDLNTRMENKLIDAGLLDPDDALGDKFKLPHIWDHKAIRGSYGEFRAWLLDSLASRPTDDYLQEVWKIDQKTFDKLGKEPVKAYTYPERGQKAELVEQELSPLEGEKLRTQILEDWSGEEYEQMLATAHARLEDAKAAEKQANKDVIDINRELFGADAKLKGSKLKKARAEIRKKEADYQWYQAEIKKAKAERQQLIRAAEAARQQKVDRLTAYSDEVPTSSADTSLDITTSIRESRSKRNAGDVVFDRVRGPESGTTKQIKGRIQEIDKQVAEWTKKSNQLAAKVDEVNARLDAAEEAFENAKRWRSEVKQLKEEMQRDRNTARKERRSAARAYKAAEKRRPIDVVVDEIVEKLTRSSEVPTAMLKDLDIESGRLKKRQLDLTDEQVLEAQRKGWLRSDVYGVLDRAHQELSATIALKEKFGSHTLRDQIVDVKREYDEIIEQRRLEGDSEKNLARLANERDRVVKDIEGLRDRLKGHYRIPDDPESLTYWIFDRFREFNFARFGAGFLISSLTDLASVSLHKIGAAPVFQKKYRKAVAEAMRGARSDELRRIVQALERSMHHSRASTIAGVDQSHAAAGLGHVGSRKHRITSAIERFTRGTSESMNFVSGMQWWNERWKALALIHMQDNVVRNIDDLLAAVSSKSKTKEQITLTDKLTSVGLGTEELTLIKRQLEKHPPVEQDGVFELGMARWMDTEEGRLAADYMQEAMIREANRAINSPGIADTPLFMSGPFGKTLMQFQTYSFTFVNRFMNPAMRRMLDQQDMQTIFSMAHLAMMASAVVTIKDLQRGEDPTERTAQQWIHDVMDRSGFLAMYSPYVALASQALGGTTPSRYYSNTFGNQMFGPSFSAITDLGSMGLTIVDPEESPSWSDVQRLMVYKPFLDVIERAAAISADED